MRWNEFATEILSYMVDLIGLFFIMATSVGLGYLVHQGAGGPWQFGFRVSNHCWQSQWLSFSNMPFHVPTWSDAGSNCKDVTVNPCKSKIHMFNNYSIVKSPWLTHFLWLKPPFVHRFGMVKPPVFTMSAAPRGWPPGSRPARGKTARSSPRNGAADSDDRIRSSVWKSLEKSLEKSLVN